jgi:hypothetical protein
VVRATVVLLHAGNEFMRWPLEVDGPLDLTVIDELARLQLGARRMGFRVQLVEVCARLAELLELVGLRVD